MCGIEQDDIDRAISGYSKKALACRYFNMRRMVLRYIEPKTKDGKNLKAYLDVTLGPGWDVEGEDEIDFLDRVWAGKTSGASAPPM